ncbi:nuclear protein localization protein 4 homolog [Lytechinus pictus]|uniref:nuclear protein localization protein 4 homolog n=1 Tax=Lytechinus pictus TaxID=7653 RepID=UPI0030B9B698
MSGTIIIRIQSPDGNKRVTLPPTTTLYKFFQKVSQTVSLPADGFNLYKSRDKTDQLKASSKVTLKSQSIKHGDMIYLFPTAVKEDGIVEPSTQVKSSIPTSSSSSSLSSSSSSQPLASVVEDEVDQFLWKQDGKIYRKRDGQLCHHGVNAECVHCVPLDSYDERYLNDHDPPIKHLSFHSHIRKLTGGVDKGKFAFLENISCKIKPGCTEHSPWPHGICTKCQPSAITLDRQHYRHVDNVMFENPMMFDRFLDFWRKSGNQRIGMLYGKYEHHKDVPLGIKATVLAIYEPPQNSTSNSLELLEDPFAEAVNYVASKLGLCKVGWIFTDLLADDLTKGTVKHVRNMDAHFMTAEECIMAGEFQNQHPSPCKLATEGHFGSKFVTCIVTGDSTNQIHTEAYQVSNQCMALVRDDCLVPTIDAPELGYIRESTNEQYVPDVFYTETDSYGNSLKQLARPLPVEFLLVDLPAGFPKDATFAFNSQPGLKPFPIENRVGVGEVQGMESLTQYMGQFESGQLMEAMLDFHLLVYLATMDLLPLRDHMDPLLEALKSRDKHLVDAWSKCEQWATMEHFIAAQGPSATGEAVPSTSGASGTSTSTFVSGTWTCERCTFINQNSAANCEICDGPRG